MWTGTYRHHFSADSPIPSQSHLEEIDSPFTSHTHTYTNAVKRSGLTWKHKEGKTHIWCPGRGTLLGSWSDINCTQIKMDLAPAVGSVIHSDAAAGEDLSGVKSDSSLSHPNTDHMQRGAKPNSCILLHWAQNFSQQLKAGRFTHDQVYT